MLVMVFKLASWYIVLQNHLHFHLYYTFVPDTNVSATTFESGVLEILPITGPYQMIFGGISL